MQHWRVAHFRVAAADINYRRFFDINELAGLRMELPEVFELVHYRVMQWLADGTLDGLRIDHVDGVQNPLACLQRLHAHISANAPGRPIYIVVEKVPAPMSGCARDGRFEGQLKSSRRSATVRMRPPTPPVRLSCANQQARLAIRPSLSPCVGRPKRRRGGSSAILCSKADGDRSIPRWRQAPIGCRRRCVGSSFPESSRYLRAAGE